MNWRESTDPAEVMRGVREETDALGFEAASSWAAHAIATLAAALAMRNIDLGVYRQHEIDRRTAEKEAT